MSSSTASVSTIAVATLGTPRIGPRRELKQALEKFWSGASDEKALIETAAGLRAANWARQKELGVTVIPSNDFSFYDQVLDTSIMVGAVPEIYGWKSGAVSLATYFAMARGSEAQTVDDACAHGHGHGGPPAQPARKATLGDVSRPAHGGLVRIQRCAHGSGHHVEMSVSHSGAQRRRASGDEMAGAATTLPLAWT